jgi:hypothetical protein
MMASAPTAPLLPTRAVAVAPCCPRLPPAPAKPPSKLGRRLMQQPATTNTTCITNCVAAAAKARSLAALLTAAAAASTKGMAQQVRARARVLLRCGWAGGRAQPRGSAFVLVFGNLRSRFAALLPSPQPAHSAAAVCASSGTPACYRCG